MIAKTQVQTEQSAPKQEIIDQIWLNEQKLANVGTDVAVLDKIAMDFVSFDASGNTIAKSEYADRLSTTSEVKLTRLWGHFGSEQSCCLAYQKVHNSGVVDICMALWIEVDGAWRKSFHHQNVKFG